MICVTECAAAVLQAGSPEDKTAAAQVLATDWAAGQLRLPEAGSPCTAPQRPTRPNQPDLVSPALVKRRRLGTQAGRVALLHAVAHIEFNAIDLAADMIARFGGASEITDTDRASFITDWVGVCADEARHFGMIQRRLRELGADYGDLPAHDGLWQAAEATSGDLTARLVIAPMVLEARGLDVTPAMIEKLKSVSDPDSAAILQVIYDDEIGHVAAGSKWFSYICETQDRPHTQTFHKMVRTYFKGLLKPPFNRAARDLAGVPLAYYEPLTQPEVFSV